MSTLPSASPLSVMGIEQAVYLIVEIDQRLMGLSRTLNTRRTMNANREAVGHRRVGFEDSERWSLTALGSARPVLHQIEAGAIPFGC